MGDALNNESTMRAKLRTLCDAPAATPGCYTIHTFELTCWPCDEPPDTGRGFFSPCVNWIYTLLPPSKSRLHPHPASRWETDPDSSAAACVAEVTGVLKVPGNEPTLSAAHRGKTVLSIFIQSKTRQAKNLRIQEQRSKPRVRNAAASR